VVYLCELQAQEKVRLVVVTNIHIKMSHANGLERSYGFGAIEER
jgi:hypothetical protein